MDLARANFTHIRPELTSHCGPTKFSIATDIVTSLPRTEAASVASSDVLSGSLMRSVPAHRTVAQTFHTRAEAPSAAASSRRVRDERAGQICSDITLQQNAKPRSKQPKKLPAGSEPASHVLDFVRDLIPNIARAIYERLNVFVRWQLPHLIAVRPEAFVPV